MAWTNITIPDQFSTLKSAYKRIYDLEKDKYYLEQEISTLYKELNNIFEAAKEYKEITLSSGNEKITLILKQGALDE